MTQIHVRGRLVLAVICAIGLVVILHSLAQAPHLLGRSTRRITLSNGGWYDWKSDSEVMLVQDCQGGPDVSTINTQTGVASRFVALSGRMAAYGCHGDYSLSPDRKTVHCFGRIGRKEYHSFFSLVEGPTISDATNEICRYDGEWDRGKMTWTSVSSRDGRLTFSRIAVQGYVETVSVAIPGDEISYPIIECISPDEHALVIDGERMMDVDTLEVYDFDLRRQVLAGIYNVKLPSVCNVRVVRVSATGASVAVVTYLPNSATGPLFFMRRLIRSQISGDESLWVARLGGGPPREIGSMPVASGLVQGSGDICDLRWLPGDRELSYVYRDAIWTTGAY